MEETKPTNQTTEPAAKPATDLSTPDIKVAEPVSKPKGKKKKQVRNVPVGKVYIKATYNNTIVTFTDLHGNVLSWSSAGMNGFRGPKKSTPFAASIIVKNAATKLQKYGTREVSVYVKGVGLGRDSAIRSLNANGLNVTSITDVTPIPHNGCRKRKPRRV